MIDHRMTATAQLADFVIAPRLQLEREDVPNVMDRRFPAVYTNYAERVIIQMMMYLTNGKSSLE